MSRIESRIVNRRRPRLGVAQGGMNVLLKSVLRQFPPVEFVFAYGSGVLRQEGRDLGKMVDLIFVVNEARKWHFDNLLLNPSHYSFLRYLGASNISTIQALPAAVYYNTLVNIKTDTRNQLIKYGVISTDDFYCDLLEWKWLYTSGRLQKPVVKLNKGLDDMELNKAIQNNYRSAMICALLLMEGNSFTTKELFHKVTSLSYMGDFRMIVGEDKNKVENIVKPALTEFENIYSSLIEEYLKPDSKVGKWTLKDPQFNLENMYHLLPATLKTTLISGKSLKSGITSIVRSSSLHQSLKGLGTAGFVKSFQYSGAKLNKMFRTL